MDVETFVKLRWAGYVVKMISAEILKKLLIEVINQTCRVGRLKARCLDGVAADARQLTAAQERTNLTEEGLVQQ